MQHGARRVLREQARGVRRRVDGSYATARSNPRSNLRSNWGARQRSCRWQFPGRGGNDHQWSGLRHDKNTRGCPCPVVNRLDFP